MVQNKIFLCITSSPPSPTHRRSRLAACLREARLRGRIHFKHGINGTLGGGEINAVSTKETRGTWLQEHGVWRSEGGAEDFRLSVKARDEIVAFGALTVGG